MKKQQLARNNKLRNDWMFAEYSDLEIAIRFPGRNFKPRIKRIHYREYTNVTDDFDSCLHLNSNCNSYTDGRKKR